MDQRTLKKQHKPLWTLWVNHKFKFGENPIPQKEKRYIMAIVNDSRRCFTVLEYNDGWTAGQDDKGETRDINIPSREVISYNGSKEINKQEVLISENEFISLLIDLIKIYSTEDLNNQLVICCRTNGAGRIVIDALKNEINGMVDGLDNARFFPVARRSKSGKELFNKPGQGWEMSVKDEKDCFDAMRTAQEQGYFIVMADETKQAFQLTSVDDKERQGNVEPFTYCWLMLSFIRLSTMNLFSE